MGRVQALECVLAQEVSGVNNELMVLEEKVAIGVNDRLHAFEEKIKSDIQIMETYIECLTKTVNEKIKRFDTKIADGNKAMETFRIRIDSVGAGVSRLETIEKDIV